MNENGLERLSAIASGIKGEFEKCGRRVHHHTVQWPPVIINELTDGSDTVTTHDLSRIVIEVASVISAYLQEWIDDTATHHTPHDGSNVAIWGESVVQSSRSNDEKSIIVTVSMRCSNALQPTI